MAINSYSSPLFSIAFLSGELVYVGEIFDSIYGSVNVVALVKYQLSKTTSSCQDV
jgi:hypothetical protein